MAEVMQLKDGKVHTIFDSKDFKWLIEQYMGYEASRYFEKAFQDILEEMNQMETTIQAKRLQKDKLSKSVQEVKKIINNQI